MRGKAVPQNFVKCSVGITPAYAGKSNISCLWFASTWDHPRLCGEKWGMSESIAPGAGSPPPMRGKAEALPIADFFVGITPAYAGKSRRKQLF